MGFICVVKSEETDVLKLKEKIWPEALAYGDDTAKTKKLENGTQVVVTSRLIAIQMKDGKNVPDTCSLWRSRLCGKRAWKRQGL